MRPSAVSCTSRLVPVSYTHLDVYKRQEQFEALENALRTMKKLAIKMEFGSGVFVTGAQMILQSGIGITVFTGTSLLMSGKIELVPMLLCLTIVTRIYGPILTELTLLPELFYHKIAIKRMRTLMSIKPMEGDEQKPVKEYDITLNNVSFRYNDQGEDTIKSVDITCLLYTSRCV